MKDRFLFLWNLPTGPWLAAGVVLVNTSAAIPFGVSDTTPGEGPDAFEWLASFLFACTVIAFFFTIRMPEARSWVASISGGLWFGVAAANLVDNFNVLDTPTLVAYTLLPIALSLCSFALARVADIEKQLVVESDP